MYEKTKKKTQTMQSKCIRFCLRLGKMDHMSEEGFRSINLLLPAKELIIV